MIPNKIEPIPKEIADICSLTKYKKATANKPPKTVGRKIINGYFPVSFFDIDLRYLLSYNNFACHPIPIGMEFTQNNLGQIFFFNMQQMKKIFKAI